MIEGKWLLAVAIVSLLSYGCSAFMPPGEDNSGKMELLNEQIKTLQSSLGQLRQAAAAGEPVQPALVSMLERQLATLQENQAAMEKALSAVGQGFGLSPGVAAGGGAVGAAIIAQLIAAMRGGMSTRRRVRQTRADMYPRIEAIEKQIASNGSG